MRRWYSIFAAMMAAAIVCGGYFAGSHHLLAPHSLAAADDCQMFPQTGFQVCGDFLVYWNSHGGLAQQGYPISATFQEKSDTDGRTYTVQYFERAVFESHPENQPPNNVLLSLLGSQKYKAKYPNGAPASGSPVVASSPAAQAPAPGGQPDANGLYHIGQRGVDGPLAVKLWEVRDPAKTDLAPSAGNKAVSFDITIENTGTTSMAYNPFNAAVRDSDDRVYSYGFALVSVTPELDSGTLPPGGKVRGWVTFAVPTTAAIIRFAMTDFNQHAVVFQVK